MIYIYIIQGKFFWIYTNNYEMHCLYVTIKKSSIFYYSIWVVCMMCTLLVIYDIFPSWVYNSLHYNDGIMGAMASQITSLTIVYSIVYLGADQRKHQSSASLAFVRGIHRWPVNSPHKGPVTRKMFPFDDVNMTIHCREWWSQIKQPIHQI